MFVQVMKLCGSLWVAGLGLGSAGMRACEDETDCLLACSFVTFRRLCWGLPLWRVVMCLARVVLMLLCMDRKPRRVSCLVLCYALGLALSCDVSGKINENGRVLPGYILVIPQF